MDADDDDEEENCKHAPGSHGLTESIHNISRSISIPKGELDMVTPLPSTSMDASISSPIGTRSFCFPDTLSDSVYGLNLLGIPPSTGTPNHGSLCARVAVTGLLIFIFVFSTLWFIWFGMWADIRTLDYIGADDGLPKHEASSLWKHITCHDWDPHYTWNKQPEQCEIEWFDHPGMVISMVGWLFALVGGLAWLVQAVCCKCVRPSGSPGGLDPELLCPLFGPDCSISARNRPHMVSNCAVFVGSGMLFLGWIILATDDSKLEVLSSSAWYGSLCGPIYVICALLKTWLGVKLGYCFLRVRSESNSPSVARAMDYTVETPRRWQD